MQTSGRNRPCPACQRTHDADCRWSEEIVLCHTGSDLRPGDTITIDGQPWYLSHHNGGFDKAAAVFKPHREQQGWSDRSADRSAELDRKARHAVASYSIERFLEHFRACWALEDFHSLSCEQLQAAFALIDDTYAEGVALNRSMGPVWRENRELADRYRWRVDSCLKSLNHQQREVCSFRQQFLGEVGL